MDNQSEIPKIVVVGGGAGGLELVTRLGRTLGKNKEAHIILIDNKSTHVWKPLLHEVAAGSLDSNIDQLNYFAHGALNYYSYQPGRMVNLDKQNKQIILAPIKDELGKIIIDERQLAYDTLVIAVGSRGNDFKIPGVKQFCLSLDNLQEANAFNQKYLNFLLSLNYHSNKSPVLNIAIVGAGATGIELAAELHRSLREVSTYGLDNPAIKQITISLIESGDRILAGLPEGVAAAVNEKLMGLNTKIYLNESVIEVAANGLYTQSGQFIPADICVWAAGIKAPLFLKKIGLETDSVNRLVVNACLQTTMDANIYAIGDCAHLVDRETKILVPAKAQAAHQEALYLAKILTDKYRNKNKIRPHFKYHDKGSIIALATYGAYGNLKANKVQYYISGKIALFTYRTLYFLHLVTLYGFWTALWFKIARSRILKLRPRMKLHFNKF